VPGRAEAPAQRGELTGEGVPGGDRTGLGERGDDVARAGALGWSGGAAGGQDAFGCQPEQVVGGRDCRGLGLGLGRRRRGSAAGRGGRLEGKPEQAGSVADQVQPPGAAPCWLPVPTAGLGVIGTGQPLWHNPGMNESAGQVLDGTPSGEVRP